MFLNVKHICKRGLLVGIFNCMKPHKQNRTKFGGVGKQICFSCRRLLLSAPALMLLGFVDAWNMVEQPLVFLQETFRYPISVFLAQMDESRMDVLCTCGILVLLPVLLLFLFGEEDLTVSAARLKI